MPRQPLRSSPVARLAGTADLPGDKSISHRALILGALAQGVTEITGLLEGEDVLNTGRAVAAMGAGVTRLPDGRWQVTGRGVLAEPEEVLDCGNSGTGARLLAGAVAGQDIAATFTGDHSLNGRPMGRVIAPLEEMGARFLARSGGRLPMTVRGAATPRAIDYVMPVASAQVKSAILLAGLRAAGVTRVTEPRPSRDHTELMLRHFGVAVGVEDLADGGRRISLAGGQKLQAAPVVVPRDPSSAAFPLVAALLVPGSEVRLAGINLNPTRAGLVETLLEMGADITIENRRLEAGEPVADLVARHSALKAVTVPEDRVPAMIDEFPILAMAASLAEGTTRMSGLEELKVKESDRLAAIAHGLAACGVKVEAGAASLAVTGGPAPAGGATIATHYDHRIAMSFLVLGLAAAAPVLVDDASAIATSFPGFVPLMNGLGARIAPVAEAA